MKILAVGSNAEVLTALDGILKQLFPNAEVVHMADPLMAGKYAFHNRVDLLLAQAEMKRMDGSQLIRFVRQEQPGVRAYLIGGTPNAAPSGPSEHTPDMITYPFRADEAAAILCPALGTEAGDAHGAARNKEGRRL